MDDPGWGDDVVLPGDRAPEQAPHLPDPPPRAPKPSWLQLPYLIGGAGGVVVLAIVLGIGPLHHGGESKGGTPVASGGAQSAAPTPSQTIDMNGKFRDAGNGVCSKYGPTIAQEADRWVQLGAPPSDLADEMQAALGEFILLSPPEEQQSQMDRFVSDMQSWIGTIPNAASFDAISVQWFKDARKLGFVDCQKW